MADRCRRLLPRSIRSRLTLWFSALLFGVLVGFGVVIYAVLDQGLSANTAFGDLQSTLPRLKAPTLLIWGGKDPIMEEDVRQSLRDALPKAEVKIFEGLGHNPFWEDPRGVAQVINGFLNTAL